MKSCICTLTDATFERGYGALFNSLHLAGYEGDMLVGKVGCGHNILGSAERKVGAQINVSLAPLERSGNVNFYKPELLLQCFRDPSVDVAFFFDADIICATEWHNFERWAQCGIAVCSDVNYLWMQENHPIRSIWARLLRELDLPVAKRVGYANGGFIGLTRDHIQVLEIWRDLLHWLDNPEKPGWDDQTLEAGFLKYDQDLLNAALMAVDSPVSFVGHEGMSFNGSVGYMVHPIGPRKPWNKGFLKDLIVHGRPMPLAARQYWKHVDHPIKVASDFEQALARVEMDVTAALSRLIAR